MIRGNAINSAWCKVRRQWHAWRARLRRQRAAVTLLALLMLSLGEPLICIIHCQFWLPFAYRSYFAAQHRHDHQGHSTALVPGATASINSAAPVFSSEGSPDPTCFMYDGVGDGASVPFHVPPSPVHDIVLALLLLIMPVLLTRFLPESPPGDPPDIPLFRLLRPPIPFAV
jgi:hypothetical protein